MKRSGKTLLAAMAVAVALAQAAHAEVTRSDNNDPGMVIADQMGLVLGGEKTALTRLSGEALGALAAGPVIISPAKATPAAKKAEKPVRVVRILRKARATDGQPVRVSAGTAAPALRYDASWLLSQPAPQGGAEWECLTEAIYFEARGESLRGQFAVAEVILNRRDSGLYPRSICGVVKQRGGGVCQFSYACDGAAEWMGDRRSRDMAGRIARVMLDGAPRMLTAGATHFHTRAVSPAWARAFPQTAAIGSHIFYRQVPGRG